MCIYNLLKIDLVTRGTLSKTFKNPRGIQYRESIQKWFYNLNSASLKKEAEVCIPSYAIVVWKKGCAWSLPVAKNRTALVRHIVEKDNEIR